MATVYLAIQESFEREVALKVMSPQLSKDPSFGERFLREARIVSRLMHPNIVTVYDVGVHEGNHYLSMEYVPGDDLKGNRYSLELDRALSIVKDVAKALDYAGRKGYIHRDVKPENIMIHAEDGRAVLMDFGIARASDVASGMTQTGTTMGTPHYMSPEQAKGAKVDPRSDLYSLGVVLFQLICGFVPFDADSAVAVGIMHVSDPIPTLPEHLAVFQPIIDKALAKKPDQRYQNGAEFIADLDAIPADKIEEIKRFVALQPKLDDVNESAATIVSAPIANTRVDTDEVAGARRDEDVDMADGAGFSVQGDDGIGDRPQQKSTGKTGWLAVAVVAGLAGGGWYYWNNMPVTSDDSQALAQSSSVATIAASAESLAPPEDVAALVNEGLASQELESQASTSSLTADTSSSTQAADTDSGALNADFQQAADTASVTATDASAAEQAAELFQAFEQDASLAAELAALYASMQRSGDAQQVEAASQGLDDMASSLQTRFDQALVDQDLTQAQELADISAQVLPDASRDAQFAEALDEFERASQIATLLAQGQTYLERDALSSPADANAVASFNAVLAQEPDNGDAQAGLDAVAARYLALAQDKFASQELASAQSLIERGLAVRPEHAELLQLQGEIEAFKQAQVEQQNTIAALTAQANEQIAQGQLIAPRGACAFDTYQQLGDEVPDARDLVSEGMVLVEQGLINRIDELIAEKNIDEALLQLDSARDRFPQSEGLLAQRLQVDQLVEASQPQIPQLRVTTEPMSDLSMPQVEELSPGRIVHVGFEYLNFDGDASVIQAVLMDGSRSVQIAQKPVIVSGAEGVKFFAIERPVTGFGKGAYHVDLKLGDARLATLSFKVSE